ncbi:MAG TPA: hypothetical protein ENO23_08515, partial [Alphaproteobacteria bacterium]|nr:hypothetical protein [Alphaproteobacteria bacterium]
MRGLCFVPARILSGRRSAGLPARLAPAGTLASRFMRRYRCRNDQRRELMPESREFAYLHVVDHPVVADRLARIRDAATPLADFRRLIHEISLLIGYE